MTPTKKIVFKYFLYSERKDWLLTFALVGFSLNSSAQLHISDNTVLTVSKNTVLDIVEEKPKVIIQNKVTLEENKKHKKTKKPLQSPMVKEGTEPEIRVSTLFTPIPKSPSTLYFISKIKKAAIINNTTNFLVKTFSLKKSHNILILFFLNYRDSQIRILQNGFLFSLQTYFEESITRPPPLSSFRKVS